MLVVQDDGPEKVKDSWTILHAGTLAKSDDVEALKDKLDRIYEANLRYETATGQLR
jgi:hypothetical protein